jgi:imidazolonepropionase-like amidohydrolase
MKFLFILIALIAAIPCAAQIAVKGETVYTMAGAPITNGVVLINNGKIERVGPASSVTIPANYRTVTAKVVTPGLIDAHTVVGLNGYLNQPNDQMALDVELHADGQTLVGQLSPAPDAAAAVEIEGADDVALDVDEHGRFRVVIEGRVFRFRIPGHLVTPWISR